MKKLVFLIGVGVGFLVGSKSGTGPYEGLETKVRSIMNRPEVRDAVETKKGAAIHQVTDTVSKVSDRSFDGHDAVASSASVPSNSA
jgi:hypothetical protein